MSKLQKNYYIDNTTLRIARDLLGKLLFTQIKKGKICSAVITETEAYLGINDRGSHAYGNKKTLRTQTMYKRGGVSYVYLCYGMHHLFNIVTEPEETPHAVLVRAVFPMEGQDIMQERTKKPPRKHLDGPGKFTRAMGITTRLNGVDLTGNTIWLEDRNTSFKDAKVDVTPRIGIDSAGKDALLPYRFVLKSRALKQLDTFMPLRS